MLTLARSVTFPRAIYKSEIFNAIFMPFDGFEDDRLFAIVKAKPHLIEKSKFKPAPDFRSASVL